MVGVLFGFLAVFISCRLGVILVFGVVCSVKSFVYLLSSYFGYTPLILRSFYGCV